MLKVGNNKCQYSLYSHIGVQENEKNERPTGTAPDRQSDYVGACRSLDTVSSLYLSVSRTKHLELRQRKAGVTKPPLVMQFIQGHYESPTEADMERAENSTAILW